MKHLMNKKVLRIICYQVKFYIQTDELMEGKGQRSIESLPQTLIFTLILETLCILNYEFF